MPATIHPPRGGRHQAPWRARMHTAHRPTAALVAQVTREASPDRTSHWQTPCDLGCKADAVAKGYVHRAMTLLHGGAKHGTDGLALVPQWLALHPITTGRLGLVQGVIHRFEQLRCPAAVIGHACHTNADGNVQVAVRLDDQTLNGRANALGDAPALPRRPCRAGSR